MRILHTTIDNRPGYYVVCALLLAFVAGLRASDQSGQITFTGLPVPGAIVTATQGEKVVTATSNEEGFYRLSGLADGVWTVKIEMSGFAPLVKEVMMAEGAPPVTFELTLLGFDEIRKTATIAVVAPPVSASVSAPKNGATADKPGAPNAPVARSAPPNSAPNAPVAPVAPDSELDRAAADGFLINGSVNNGAASPFAQARAFGNTRNGGRSLYNGGLGMQLGNSAWDSRPFSFTAGPAPKPSYTDLLASGTLGGPLKIPGVRNKPQLFFGYQRSSDHTATTQSALMPTALERAGDFSQTRDAQGRPVQVLDAATGEPFSGNAIPASRISPQAAALLAYYPQPNVPDAAGGYNFQSPVLVVTRQDNVQSRFTQTLSSRSSLAGNLQYQRTRSVSTSIFKFDDASNVSSLNGSLTWNRRFSQFFSLRATYQHLRQTTSVTPYFANRANVSGLAGIGGNDQSPENWGPPALIFSNGIAGLSDGQYTRSSSQTHAMSAESNWRTRGRHAVILGGEARPQTVDVRSQQDPRGRFSFTGAATGNAFADFLLGIPHTGAIAFGSAGKLLRSTSLNAYVTDDWRVSPTLTLTLGARWEYEGPFSEASGRLSNLAAAADFTSVSVTTATPSNALIRPDRRGLEPRLGAAWRPVPASSLVIRAGYGVTRNANVYQSIALLLAQQPPFSKALSVENSAANPLTLANGFVAPATGASNTFAVDPELHVASADNFQVSVQRDLPASLTVIATYLGTRGRHLMQEFVPNTYPAGAVNPCATCPTGFVYLTSNGHSARNAGQLQLRRRLRSGLTATAQYTFAKAEDNAASFAGADLSGSAIAQDWRHLDGEWGRSSFDQRHQLVGTFEYTTGMGSSGGALLTGKTGALYKGWTVTGQLTVGSGLPLTPVYLGSLAGTGVIGAIRADYTGQPIGAAPSGYYLNPAAFAPPAPGQWGNAARNSITGPSQFSFNTGLARTFLWGPRLTFEWHADATNILNRVTYSGVNTTVGSPQFGLPNRANQMRKVQTNLRMRF
jgi:hypothetical protein